MTNIIVTEFNKFSDNIYWKLKWPYGTDPSCDLLDAKLF